MFIFPLFSLQLPFGFQSPFSFQTFEKACKLKYLLGCSSAQNEKAFGNELSYVFSNIRKNLHIAFY